MRENLPLWETRKHQGKLLQCVPSPREGFPCDFCFFQAGKMDLCAKPKEWSGCTEFNRPDQLDTIFILINRTNKD